MAPKASSETSPLLITRPQSYIDNDQRASFRSKRVFCWSSILVVVVVVVTLVLVGTLVRSRGARSISHQEQRAQHAYNFPSDFVWGTATSSYQIEGAVGEDGRGKTIWDDFCDEPTTILDHSSGAVACDHYHRMREDVQLLKKLNIKAYRFSVAWSRIMPTGQGHVNEKGVDFYNDLIDELVENDIEPWITLFHWDLPAVLEKEYGGWLNETLPDIFAEYARVVFTNFGDRVRRWITINEPWTVAVNGYASGLHAPGHQSPTEPYIVAHHLLLAHAKAARVYRGEFKDTQMGLIGLANSGDYRYPLDSMSKQDHDAAQRAMLFQLGWFLDPILYHSHDYPQAMRQRLGDRLPIFTKEERYLLRNSVDFVGLNYYSSFLVTSPSKAPSWQGYWSDIFVEFISDPRWEQNDMGWNIAPEGLREMLVWIKDRYSDPVIYITENGSAEKEPNVETALKDEQRRIFYEDHLRACAQAIQSDHVDVRGYFAWSFMDNFEWQFGYQRRFGMCYVDFETQERTPKSSAAWYKETISKHGQNIELAINDQPKHSRRLGGSDSNSNRQLPSKVLIGYGSDIDAVRTAVHQGVNIVIWAFIYIARVGPKESAIYTTDQRHLGSEIVVRTNLDLGGIRSLQAEFRDTGYGDTLHFVSVGGWNGPHLDDSLGADEWYIIFQELFGDIFDGIDWDLEGNDELGSPTNYFSLACLQGIGRISRLAKQNRQWISMAPPQSYLDFHGSHRFSRFVNLTDASRSWHAEFQYFGANVYAYLLAVYGNWIDLVSIQFYESYSRAAMVVNAQEIQASEYLASYAREGLDLNVTFSDDPDVSLADQLVHLPLSKLIFGFANGWADNDSDKTLYMSPTDIQLAWDSLNRTGTLPRGFMFWTIDEEGLNGTFFAHELRKVLDSFT